MCSALAMAIDEFEISLDSKALRQALGLLDRLRAKVTAAVGGFDRAELWDLDDAASMTAWLKTYGGATAKTAMGTVRAGQLVVAVPEVGDAVEGSRRHGRSRVQEPVVVLADDEADRVLVEV